MRILVEVVEDVDAVLVLETRPGVNGLVDHLAFISVVCFNLGEELMVNCRISLIQLLM
jgi:hypothetical protein